MSLHPTKTRVALLAAVERGDVLDLPDPDNDGHTATFDLTDAEIGMPARRVNARVDEFVREGWVRLSVEIGRAHV